MTFDVTELKQAELAQARSERRLRDITDHLPVLISYVDQDERMTYANDTFLRATGALRERLIGSTVLEVIGPVLHGQRAGLIRRALDGERLTFEMESTIAGERKHFQATYVPDVAADGRVLGMTALSVDVTALKNAQERLSLLAHSDALTGLPNRLLLNSKLDAMIAAAPAAVDRQALMFLDIDHFKAINDTHGHAIGDMVLKTFAQRIRHSVRPTDFVARLAGDEFVILLGALRGMEEAQAVARKLVRDIERPFTLDGGDVRGDGQHRRRHGLACRRLRLRHHGEGRRGALPREGSGSQHVSPRRLTTGRRAPHVRPSSARHSASSSPQTSESP